MDSEIIFMADFVGKYFRNVGNCQSAENSHPCKLQRHQKNILDNVNKNDLYHDDDDDERI